MNTSHPSKSKKITKRISCLIAIIPTTLFLNGCVTTAAALTGGALALPGLLNTSSVTDDLLREKAAFTLSTSADNVKISNRNEKEKGTIYFTATVNGKKSECYITTVAGHTSDAICNNSRPTSSNQSCNALLRAANRCD